MKNQNRQYRWLVLPVENYIREFNGKLLLAAVAAERGWATIMGYKGYVRNHLPPMRGVAIEINMHNESRFEHYSQEGWRVSAWDEEGLIYLNGEEYCRRRVDAAAIKKLDCVFLWGQNQQDDLARYTTGAQNKWVLSGNPRADLLRPDLRQFYAADVARITRAHGPFILINTNFGYVNHYFGRDYIFKVLSDQGGIASEAQAADQRAREQHQEALMRAFIGMLPALSEQFAQHKIVVRPHPSEDFDTWRNAVQGLPNVSMIHEGDAVPWILASAAVIHNSCTTGVQAYLLDRPVISYMPVRSETYDQYLPNALSSRAADLDELLALVRRAVLDAESLSEAPDENKRQIARKYVACLDGPWAAQRIMDQIDKLEIGAQPVDPALASALRADGRRPSVNARAMLRSGLRRLRDALRRKGPPTPPGTRTWATYTNQRFPSLTLDEMRGDLERLKEATGRFADVRLYHTAEDLICILPSAI